MKKNQDYKNAALAALKGNWSHALVATIVFLLISLCFVGPFYAIDPMAYPKVFLGLAGGLTFAELLVIIPLQVGYYNTLKELYVSGDNRLTSNMFSLGFRKYFKVIVTYLLYGIIVMIGFLIFIIPGFILAFAYALVPYLLVDEPDLSITQTLKRSRLLMKGHKFDLFYLELSFIGWALLAILTIGIGYLWLIPYIYTSIGVFYKDVVNGTAGMPVSPAAMPSAEPAASAPENYMPSDETSSGE